MPFKLTEEILFIWKEIQTINHSTVDSCPQPLCVAPSDQWRTAEAIRWPLMADFLDLYAERFMLETTLQSIGCVQTRVHRFRWNERTYRNERELLRSLSAWKSCWRALCCALRTTRRSNNDQPWWSTFEKYLLYLQHLQLINLTI